MSLNFQKTINGGRLPLDTGQDLAVEKAPVAAPPSESLALGHDPSSVGDGWSVVHRRKGKVGSLSTAVMNQGISGAHGGRLSVRRREESRDALRQNGKESSRFRSGTKPPLTSKLTQTKSQAFPVQADAKKLKYSDVVAHGQYDTPNYDLKFYESVSSEKALISKEDQVIAVDMWKNSLMMYVVGPRPYFVRLNDTLNRLWKSKGMKLYARENGFFIAMMSNETECERIINTGPWMVDGSLLIVKRWNTNMTFEKELLVSAPTWIRLPELPLIVWNPTAISKIVSMIGRPIRMDEHTANLTHISFARVLVEINSDQVIQESVNVQIEGGNCFKQPVIFEKLPPKCKHCKVFGHGEGICPVKIQAIWVKKGSQEDGAVTGSSGLQHAVETVQCVNVSSHGNISKNEQLSGHGYKISEGCSCKPLGCKQVGRSEAMTIGEQATCRLEKESFNPPFSTGNAALDNMVPATILLEGASRLVEGNSMSSGSDKTRSSGMVEQRSENEKRNANEICSVNDQAVEDRNAGGKMEWQKALIEEIQTYSVNNNGSCGVSVTSRAELGCVSGPVLVDGLSPCDGLSAGIGRRSSSKPVETISATTSVHMVSAGVNSLASGSTHVRGGDGNKNLVATPFPDVNYRVPRGTIGTLDDSIYWSNVRSRDRGPRYTCFSEDDGWGSTDSIDNYENKNRYISKNKVWLKQYTDYVEYKKEKSKKKSRKESTNKVHNTRARSQQNKG